MVFCDIWACFSQVLGLYSFPLARLVRSTICSTRKVYTWKSGQGKKRALVHGEGGVDSS